MNHRITSLFFAGSFFLFWLIVLYAGADHPPPRGFLWAVFLDAVAAGLILRRMPTYIAWSSKRKPRRHLLALWDGAGTGLLFAGFCCFIPNTGQPGVHRGPLDYAIWFAVLMAVGMVNGLGLYALGALARRWFSSR